MRHSLSYEYRNGSPSFIPPETCPDIDEVIEKMEELRAANEQLRRAAEHFQELYESELEDNRALNQANDALEDEVADLRRDLAAAKLEGVPF